VEAEVVLWVEAAAAAAVTAGGATAGEGLKKGGNDSSLLASPSKTPSKKGSKQQQPSAQQQGGSSSSRAGVQLTQQRARQLEVLLQGDQLASVWAGLQLLPHASQSCAHAVGLCERVKDTTSTLCGSVQASETQSEGYALAAPTATSAVTPAAAAAAAGAGAHRRVAALVCLHAQTLELMAELLPAATAQHAEQGRCARVLMNMCMYV
jgi:hypothetical protein